MIHNRDEQVIDWLKRLVELKGSDLYLSVGSVPRLRLPTGFDLIDIAPLDDRDMSRIVAHVTNPDQASIYSREREFNMSLDLGERYGRFRLNIYRQRNHPAMVFRRIAAHVPTMEEMGLPRILGDLVMEARGLILVVGGTGSGKSTSLAAMIDHRNKTAEGHILTLEDPIEYVHRNIRCLVSQREIGTDTMSFEAGMENALRQRPDLVLVGEIRNRHVMRQALSIAETGHLAMATLHANNADQAIARVLSFFEMEEQPGVLLNLGFNLRGILGQRLVHDLSGGKTAALEIMLCDSRVSDILQRGATGELKAAVAGRRDEGMQTFDECLADLWKARTIDANVAVAEADDKESMRRLVGSGAPSPYRDADR